MPVLPARSSLGALVVAIVGITIGLSRVGFGQDPTRGKTIYTTGTSTSGGAVQALLPGGEPAPARQLPCIQCHRSDGRGGWEAGVVVPNIRPERLGATYGVRDGLGRWRPTYTRELLERAIREGRSSAGDLFQPVMPRYAIEGDDLADLLAYLALLGTEPAPGTDPATVRIASLLPRSGPLASQGRSVGLVLERYFAWINERGGVHGRRIVLELVDVGGSAEAARAAAQELLEEENVFCIVASGGEGASPAVSGLLDDRDVPVIGPLVFPERDPEPSGVFYLIARLEDQIRAAAQALAAEVERVALEASPSLEAQRLASIFRQEAERRQLAIIESDGELADRVGTFAGQGLETLVVFGDASYARQLLERAEQIAWQPRVVASAVILEGRLQPPPGGLDLIAPPIGLGLSAAEDEAAFDSLAAGTLPEHRTMGMAAHAAAQVVVAGLENSGREIDRATFLEALEGLTRLETGVMPPVTFGRFERLGVRGALIVRYDAGGRPERARWSEVKDDER